MRRGRTEWSTRCPPAVKARADAAIAAGRQSAAEIHAELDLGRWCRRSTFAKYVAVKRRDLAARRAEAPAGDSGAPPSSPCCSGAPDAAARETAEAVLRTALDRMLREIELGEVPAYALPAFVRACVHLGELVIGQDGNRRAAELHEIKLADLRRKQAAALDEVSQATGLTDEQLGQIRSRVLGI